MRWIRVRWRWFRLEFNRRAHNRVYYDEPMQDVIYDRVQGVIYGHPAVLKSVRDYLPRPAPGSERGGGRGGLARLAGLDLDPFGVQLMPSPLMVKRKWRWVRR